jgi:ketosteroid isomerase-like protein
MMTEPEARAFAWEWVEAWNSHDLDRIMAHYAEDFAMTSPFIAALMQEPSGTITGKANVRAYWDQALKKVPDLNFKLIDVLVGVDSITIYYQAVFGKRAAEVLFFDTNHQVKRGIAHYISG